MRIESSVTSVSWIPLGAVERLARLPFEWGIAQYDEPPPDELVDLRRLRAANGFRFANELRAWVDVEGGRITASGQSGGGHLGGTVIRLGGHEVVIQAVALPELRPAPEVGATRARFVQTAGGRTGLPLPRTTRQRPFIRVTAPLAWSTLALTVHADGSSSGELLGASQFPRHWVYDHAGRLVAKSGLVDFRAWAREAYEQNTPWGGEESPVIVSAVESALERRLSRLIIGAMPPFRTLRQDELLVRQDEPGDELYLLFDGVMAVEVDGEEVAEVGPGAVVGEMALLSAARRRTASLRARTECRVAAIPGDRIDRRALAELAAGRGLVEPE
jgi:Cyclic nucleotide-binding domain